MGGHWPSVALRVWCGQGSQSHRRVEVLGHGGTGLRRAPAPGHGSGASREGSPVCRG